MGVITPFRTAGCGGGLQLCWFLLFTGHLCPSDLARGPLSHRLVGTVGWGETSKSDSKCPLGRPPLTSGNPLPQEAMGCQTWGKDER